MAVRALLAGLLCAALAALIAMYVAWVAAAASSPFPTAPLEKQRVQVLGRSMAYHERGAGAPVLFLHGNPTSSYLWRNVIPGVCDGRALRCVAPDLIGMGDSEKITVDEADPDSTYHFTTHREHLAEFVEEVFQEELARGEKITLVIHDWGSALGFDWASRHPESVRGVAFMEAIVMPFTDETMGPVSRAVFALLKMSRLGEYLVLQHNAFIDYILPFTILRPLSLAEKQEYRRPFLAPGEDRRPTLTWPRLMPVNGHPPEMVEIAQRYSSWMANAKGVPKLWINAEPGAIVRKPATRAFVRSWPNLTETTVPGSHFIQEDSPYEIADAVREWMDAHVL
eukprot:TRINITY_DN5282_c0_g1_i1.p1 TRINITY_DN5282_c0_g1~~TRINITY_DN5282_c0_g1_i1.p1  ORF type:complete len:339 (-),score=79.13 TRINITY_DN5282_c0_g1_i1:246-1262(-)